MPAATSSSHVRVSPLTRTLLETLARASGQSMARYLERVLRGQALIAGLDMSHLAESEGRGGKR